MEAAKEAAPDAYALLGVDPTASAGEIKKRFWKLSLLVHPDKCSHPRAKDAFDVVSRTAKSLQVGSSSWPVCSHHDWAMGQAVDSVSQLPSPASKTGRSWMACQLLHQRAASDLDLTIPEGCCKIAAAEPGAHPGVPACHPMHGWEPKQDPMGPSHVQLSRTGNGGRAAGSTAIQAGSHPNSCSQALLI